MKLYTFELEDIDLEDYKMQLLETYKVTELLTDKNYFYGEFAKAAEIFLNEIEKELMRLGSKVKLVRNEEVAND